MATRGFPIGMSDHCPVIEYRPGVSRISWCGVQSYEHYMKVKNDRKQQGLPPPPEPTGELPTIQALQPTTHEQTSAHMI